MVQNLIVNINNMDILEFLEKLQKQKVVDHNKSVQECVEALEKMPMEKAMVLMAAVGVLAQRMTPPILVKK